MAFWKCYPATILPGYNSKIGKILESFFGRGGSSALAMTLPVGAVPHHVTAAPAVSGANGYLRFE